MVSVDSFVNVNVNAITSDDSSIGSAVIQDEKEMVIMWNINHDLDADCNLKYSLKLLELDQNDIDILEKKFDDLQDDYKYLQNKIKYLELSITTVPTLATWTSTGLTTRNVGGKMLGIYLLHNTALP